MRNSLAAFAVFLAIYALLPSGGLRGQSGENTRQEALSSLNASGSAASESAASGSAAPESEAVELPRTFRSISLGIGLDELKEALAKDIYFNFRGDRDVSMLPHREETLIDTPGFSFIRRAYFQLKDNAVFIMAFTLNPALVDHYSVYTAFTKKYGEPAILDPRQSVWISGTTRVSIERPLTVKYIDMGVFNELIDESNTKENSEIRLRQLFLDDF